MEETIFDRIALIRQHSTKQDRVLIDFLENTPARQLTSLSISEFASLAKVSESTLLRFCRKLGLRGYSEFRILLVQHNSLEYADGDENYARTIMQNMSLALKSTYELLDNETIEKVAALLLNANRIYCFGSGNSSVAAEEMRNKFLRFGIHIDYLADNHLQAIATATMTENDVLVLFSVSGSTKDMLEIADQAKAKKIKLVIITNYLKSPLSNYANYTLHVVAKSAPLDSGSLVAKISQLYIIDVLATAVFKQIKDVAQHNLELTAFAVLNKEI